MNEKVIPWRFIANQDVPECGIVSGDIIVAFPGRPTRVLRHMPINPGLLLNLHMQDIITPIEGVVGADSGIVKAMENADRAPTTKKRTLRVIR